MRNFDFYEITIPPANLPVLFTEASEWCRDIDVADTSLVNSLLSAANDQVELLTNRVLVSRTITGKFSNFSFSKFENYYFVEIRRAPLVSVTTVKVNGALLLSSDYIVKNKNGFSRILFKNDYSLDSSLDYAIEVEFVAGYTTVPPGIITAIKEIVLFWYENRGDVSTDGKMIFPLSAKLILNQYKILATYG